MKRSPAPYGKLLKKIYKRLFLKFGPQSWWPAESRFEVIIGAILTQNTSWENVELAIGNLKSENLLSAVALKRISKRRLARLIKPSGYFNVKSERLKFFIGWLYKNYGGDINRLFKLPLPFLRRQLLEVKGIGPETADSIILYAATKPTFVVDAYTRRIFSRHAIIKEDDAYDDIQGFFLKNLKPSVRIFNEFHALIVKLAKSYCKRVPQCRICPLQRIL